MNTSEKLTILMDFQLSGSHLALFDLAVVVSVIENPYLESFVRICDVRLVRFPQQKVFSKHSGCDQIQLINHRKVKKVICKCRNKTK